MVDRVRALPRRPEAVAGTWRAARAEAPGLGEAETLALPERLDPLWEEPFPAGRARIVRLLVERVEVSPAGADVRLRSGGAASLMRGLGGIGTEARRAAWRRPRAPRSASR